jgi:hypothetical protein
MTLAEFPTTVSDQAAHGTGSTGALLAAAAPLGATWTAATDSASSAAGAQPIPANARQTAETLRTFAPAVLVMT